MDRGELVVVPYEHERHGAALLSLFARVWGEEASRRRCAINDALHERMPVRDRHPLRYIAMDGDRAAGTLGCLPADFLVNGGHTPVRFTCDLLVDPRYATAGMRLARRTLGTVLVEQARLQGDFFVGGMWMTHSSHRIHLAAGFDDAMTLPSYTLPLDPRPFVARRGLTAVKSGAALAGLTALRACALTRAKAELVRGDVQLEACDRFDESLDATWRNLARSYAVTRVRDAAYLNWKYADHPTLPYRILLARRGGKHTGYMIWRPPTPDDECRRAVVVDFLVARGDARTLRRLVSRVVVDANRAGTESISMLTTQPWAAATLRRMGYFPRPGGNTWVVAGWQNHVPRGWLFEPDRWHLCMGDSDGDIWAGITAAKPESSAPAPQRPAGAGRMHAV